MDKQTAKTHEAASNKRDYALGRMMIALDRVIASQTKEQRKKVSLGHRFGMNTGNPCRQMPNKCVEARRLSPLKSGKFVDLQALVRVFLRRIHCLQEVT
jgi:hypothetical protein